MIRRGRVSRKGSWCSPWWAWTAYAWLTDTISPEEGGARIAMFGAMGTMPIASLAVPDVFGDDAFLFACAYGMVRPAHLVHRRHASSA